MSEEQREQFYDSVGERLPVGRVGTVEEVAQAYVERIRHRADAGVDAGTVLV